MKYRDNDYFNEQEHYVVETNLNKLLVTKMHFEKGNWYTNAGMQYKATSVRSIRASEFITGVSVERKGFLGTVTTNLLEPSYVGVIWNRRQRHPFYYWNNINNLNKVK